MKGNIGDVRVGSQGDAYPFVVVGREVYDDNGNLVEGLSFHVQDPAGQQASGDYPAELARGGLLDRIALAYKNGGLV